MDSLIEEYEQGMTRDDIPEIDPGDTVRVHLKIYERVPVERRGARTAQQQKEERTVERVQVFEGTVLAVDGSGLSRTITVRRVASGVGVEKVFPVNSNRIEKIEVTRHSDVSRAKLYYLRERSGKSAKLEEKR